MHVDGERRPLVAARDAPRAGRGRVEVHASDVGVLRDGPDPLGPGRPATGPADIAEILAGTRDAGAGRSSNRAAQPALVALDDDCRPR